MKYSVLIDPSDFAPGLGLFELSCGNTSPFYLGVGGGLNSLVGTLSWAVVIVINQSSVR